MTNTLVKYSRALHGEGLVDFLQAWDHDDLPDGAWQAMLEEGVVAYTEEFGIQLDSHEGFIEYCHLTAPF